MTATRICNRCKCVKPLDKQHFKPCHRVYLSHTCRDCLNALERIRCAQDEVYRCRTRARQLHNQHTWRQRNPARYAAVMRAWRTAHREEQLIKARLVYQDRKRRTYAEQLDAVPYPLIE